MKGTARQALRFLPQAVALVCIQKTATGQTTQSDNSFHVTGTSLDGPSTNPNAAATYGASSTLDNSGTIDTNNNVVRRNGTAHNNTGATTYLKSIDREIGRIHVLEIAFLMLIGGAFLLLSLIALRHRRHGRRLMTP